MAKPALKTEAIRLRRGERLSINEILARLNGRVAKSTLSLWLRGYPLEEAEREEKMNVGRARSRNAARKQAEPIQKLRDVFGRQPTPKALRDAAIAVAVEWFMSRGYGTSVPLDQRPYDLVVESDAGLQRVQVKSTNSRENGAWQVNICRSVYEPTATLNANGRRKRRSYTRDEIDIFFIVTGTRDAYLIPIDAVEGKTAITLDRKYRNFRSVA